MRADQGAGIEEVVVVVHLDRARDVLSPTFRIRTAILRLPARAEPSSKPKGMQERGRDGTRSDVGSAGDRARI